MAQASLRRAHRAVAYTLATFILLHLFNHLVIIFGAESHLAVMDTIRPIYRNPGVETAIFASFALQIGLGARLIWRRGKPRLFWGWMQVGSCGVIALVLLQHMIAVVMTRWSYPNIATDIYWAASVVSRPAFAAYFAPYYIIGIIALLSMSAPYSQSWVV